MLQLQLLEKVYARVMKRQVHLLVEPWIQKEQCCFHPGRGTRDQLFILLRIFEGCMFAQLVYMHFVDLEKEFAQVPCGGCFGSMGCK